MIDLKSNIAQLLEELVNDWMEDEPEYEAYDLKIALDLVKNPAMSGAAWERELFYKIKEELGPESWQNLPELIREYRTEAPKWKEHESKKQVLLQNLKEHLERDFSTAYDFFQAHCTAHISCEEYEIEKNNVERRERGRQEKVRREREAKQRAEKERREAAQQREKERQKRIRHEKEKQILLKSLREHFRQGQDFLTAYDFYQTQCTAHISFEEYEAEKINYVQFWARNHVDTNPDHQQAAAIGAVEGHVQVVARAGSGKTATLVNRALFLQQHCGVAPDKILLLAFNRKAADEMRERINSYLQDFAPHVMTFHALAYAMVHPGKILFDEAEGEESQSRAIQDMIGNYLHDRNYYDQIRALMMAYFRADWNSIVLGGHDRTPEEMLRYRRSLTWESLDGTYVKSFGEKVIANFLFEHGIPYKYERNFRWHGINYRPDFTIGDRSGVVIEYFGLEGDPDYDAMSEQKRDYWRNERKWELLEFSPNDLKSNGIEGFRTLLKQKLEACEIVCNQLSEEKIWNRIKHLRPIGRFTTVVKEFIQRCRKLSLTPEQLLERINNHDCDNDIEQRFLNLVEVFYKAYLEQLQAEGEEDFDGLIQNAGRLVAEGKTEFRYKSSTNDLERTRTGNLEDIRYVLIDEYQDFSELFYRLMQVSREQNPHARFFCVGDDWQAINGFAGSDLRFFQNFEQFFEDARELPVATNYRSAKAIVNIGNVLMKHRGIPARAHKIMTGKVTIAVLDTFVPTSQEKEENPGNNFTSAVLRLVHKVLNDGKNVVLLSRTNSSSPSIKGKIKSFRNFLRSGLSSKLAKKVTISTVHKYKGLEKTVVIVLDVVPRCYPLIHPNLIFTRVLGNSVESVVAEERRLFYVALTRAVEELFILTEADNFSPFLEDLERNIKLPRLEWSDYPPTEHIIIRISNQDGRGTEPTKAIKRLLRSDNYRWHFKSKFWYSIRPIEGFSVREFINRATWSKSADGIAVRFYDLESKVALYHVDGGQWNCIYDNIQESND